MKKFLLLAFFSAVVSAAVFAKETVHNLDVSVPVDWRELEPDSDYSKKKVDENSISVDFDYSMMTVNENGFSFIFGANAGYASTKVEKTDDRLNGLDLGLKLGWGGIPLNLENFVLGLHAFFGFGLRTLKFSDDSADYKWTFFNTKIGADVVAIYRINDRVGINASVDLYTNLPALGTLDVEGDIKDNLYFFSCLGGIGVAPKLGVSLFF